MHFWCEWVRTLVTSWSVLACEPCHQDGFIAEGSGYITFALAIFSAEEAMLYTVQCYRLPPRFTAIFSAEERILHILCTCRHAGSPMLASVQRHVPSSLRMLTAISSAEEVMLYIHASTQAIRARQHPTQLTAISSEEEVVLHT
jgi:hypothetical protein